MLVGVCARVTLKENYHYTHKQVRERLKKESFRRVQASEILRRVLIKIPLLSHNKYASTHVRWRYLLMVALLTNVLVFMFPVECKARDTQLLIPETPTLTVLLPGIACPNLV